MLNNVRAAKDSIGNLILNLSLGSSRETRRNGELFEEFSSDSLERECDEEICDPEVMREIFPETVRQREIEWDNRLGLCL